MRTVVRSILSTGFGCAFTLAAAGACVETTPAPRLNLNSDVRGTNWWVRLQKPHLDAFCGRPDPLVAQVLPNLSLEGRDFAFGVIAYTPAWSALPLKDHFRLVGGWTRLADGRVRGDIHLDCVKPCELGVLALSAGFPLDPVAGRMWMADGVSRTLPVKQSKDILLGSGEARTFLFPLPDGRTLRAAFDEPVPYRAQDLRAWGPNWGVRLGGCQARRTYAVGDTVAFTVVLSAAEGLRIRRETTSK